MTTSGSVNAGSKGSSGLEVPPRAAIILVTLIAGAFVANINLSIANVALPDIGRELGATTVQQTAVASMFTLGLASSVLYLGAIGDRYGRRRLLLLGAALTIPAGLASAYAPTVEFLIAARFVAGLAAGLMFPTTLSLITAMWRGTAKTKAIALWSGIGGGAASLGGVVGGALLEVAWWGSVFLFALPIALVVFLLAAKYVPADKGEGSEPVDHLGGVLSVVAVASLVTAVQRLPHGIDALEIGFLVVAVAATVLFIVRQRRASNPLVDLHAAAVPPFWVAAVAGTITFGSLMGALFLGQQFAQNVLGYSTLTAALVTLALNSFHDWFSSVFRQVGEYEGFPIHTNRGPTDRRARISHHGGGMAPRCIDLRRAVDLRRCWGWCQHLCHARRPRLDGLAARFAGRNGFCLHGPDARLRWRHHAIGDGCHSGRRVRELLR